MKSKVYISLVAMTFIFFSHLSYAINLSTRDQSIILNQILPKPNTQSVALNDKTIGRSWQINNQKLYRDYSQFSNSLKPKFAYTFIHHMMKYDTTHMLVLFGTYIGETPEYALPEMNSCHACSPILGIALFEKNQSTQQYHLKEIQHAVSALGSFGALPDPELFKLVTLGKNQLGLEIYSSYGNMGTSEEYFQLIQIASEFKSLLNLTIGSNNCASGHPTCENQTAVVKINESNPNLAFYPIEILTTIEKAKKTKNDEYKTVSKKKVVTYYRFDSNSFKYKLIK